MFLLVCTFMLVIFPACTKYYPADSSDSTDDGQTITGSEDVADYVWNAADVTDIVLNGTAISESSEGVTVDGSKATITTSGTYRISGSLTNGQIIVDTKDEGIVRLILNGINVTCSNSAPIYIEDAVKTLIVLADNTENFITDGTSYVLNADNEPNAAVFSKSYLSFYGAGSLTVNANYKDGITGKDGLVIKSGTINVNSADDGIRGKDYLIVKKGLITINSKGDGLKSDNELDTSLGYITIDSASLNITAGGDGINARTNLLINDGSFTIKTGGGATSGSGYSGTLSKKALKATTNITIAKGTFVINSADDAIHSNVSVAINGGTLSIATGDDAVHAEESITLDGSTINVSKCYEGFESALITVKSGNVSLISTDDGFNATKGRATEANDGSNLIINGGFIVVNSSKGDGLDSNGNVEMTGGTVGVHGPQSQPEVGFDVNGTFNISGGLLIGTGPNSGNMIEATSTTSSQYAVKATISSNLAASTLFHIQDTGGSDLVTFKPLRAIYYVVFSSPALTNGSTYYIYTGGTSTGTDTNGLYSGGIYSGGTQRKSFTISGKVTNISF